MSGRDTNSKTAAVYILAPSASVKSIKTILEWGSKFNKSVKISKIKEATDLNDYVVPKNVEIRKYDVLIPTSLTLEFGDRKEWHDALEINTPNLIHQLKVGFFIPDVLFAVRPQKIPIIDVSARSCNNGALAQIIRQWLRSLSTDLQSTLHLPIPDLSALGSWTYTIYPPLLILPASTFARSPWPTLISTLLEPHLPALYALIRARLHVTHIALNAPIPLFSTTDSVAKNLKPKTPPLVPNRCDLVVPTDQGAESIGVVENILRAPTHLQPLHGYFGPLNLPPSLSAFASVLWVSTRQHGIYQAWAPLYTMFSRGNISEKARILSLPELRSDVLGMDVAATSAVDLYAGIGYFAFCYAKNGVGMVLCWEINGWSIEGLRRGALGNGWGFKVIKDGADVGENRIQDGRCMDAISGKEKIIVFPESNEWAAGRVQKIRDKIPPIRHVNCGYLPSSKRSWETAINILDPSLGGWVHAHENIAIADIEKRTSEIIQIFQCLANPTTHEQAVPWFRNVHCLHLHRIKTYAPGVMHCVLDIYISAPAPSSAPLNTNQTITTLTLPAREREG